MLNMTTSADFSRFEACADAVFRAISFLNGQGIDLTIVRVVHTVQRVEDKLGQVIRIWLVHVQRRSTFSELAFRVAVTLWPAKRKDKRAPQRRSAWRRPRVMREQRKIQECSLLLAAGIVRSPCARVAMAFLRGGSKRDVEVVQQRRHDQIY